MRSPSYDDEFNSYKEPILIGNDFSHLFACGKNENFELTFRGYKVIDTPSGTTFPKNKKVVSVSSGGSHASLLTSEGTIYMIGSTLHGMLGIPNLTAMNVSTPKPLTIHSDMKFIQVVCGDYHTLALSSEGEVFGWGGNLHKKLSGNSGLPTKIESIGKHKIIKIACGDFHSAALSCFLTSNRNTFYLGRRRSSFQQRSMRTWFNTRYRITSSYKIF